MTAPEFALILFTACNSVRVLAYVPQIAAVVRDRNGASAISYTTWGMFAVSHFSTVIYAYLVLLDWRMAGIFGANTLCCVLIVGLTAHKRGLLATRLQPLLRGRFGLLSMIAILVAGAALALSLGPSSDTTPQTMAPLAANQTPPPGSPEPVLAPKVPEAAVEHYRRLFSGSHGFHWEPPQSAPWPFTLDGTWEVEPSGWRMFEGGNAAPTAIAPWSTLFPPSEALQEDGARTRMPKSSADLRGKRTTLKRPRGSKPVSSSRGRR